MLIVAFYFVDSWNEGSVSTPGWSAARCSNLAARESHGNYHSAHDLTGFASELSTCLKTFCTASHTVCVLLPLWAGW